MLAAYVRAQIEFASVAYARTYTNYLEFSAKNASHMKFLSIHMSNDYNK